MLKFGRSQRIFKTRFLATVSNGVIPLNLHVLILYVTKCWKIKLFIAQGESYRKLLKVYDGLSWPVTSTGFCPVFLLCYAVSAVSPAGSHKKQKLLQYLRHDAATV
jgi:hypothetical protein